jgi:diphosphomevalonate decarboxylase
MASRPAIRYWQPATLKCLDEVRRLRDAEGLPAFATMDAGPHVKVLTSPEHSESIHQAMEKLSCVDQVLTSSAGEGARLHDE